MTDKEIKQLTKFFSVIQDETRLVILLSLMDKPLCVNEIVVATSRSQSLISHQLIVLKKHGLVVGERRGNFVYYSLKDDCVKNIIDTTFKHVCQEETL